MIWPSLFLADLPHAADADAQIVEHALRDGHEFLTRRRYRNAPRAAIEQPDAENILDALDSSGQSGLRSFQKRGCGDEAVILSYGEYRVQLTGSQIGDVS